MICRPMASWRIVPCLILVLGMTGCVTVDGNFGTPIPAGKVMDIVDGQTTRQQIVEWFGPPSAFFRPSLLDLIGGDEDDVTQPVAPMLEDVYTYRYIETEATITFFPILFLYADLDNRNQTLIVYFDDDDLVRYHAYREDDHE